MRSLGGASKNSGNLRDGHRRWVPLIVLLVGALVGCGTAFVAGHENGPSSDAGIDSQVIIVSPPNATPTEDGGDGGSESGLEGDGGDGAVCDTSATADPMSEPCLVNETNGVFVSMSGSDGGAGTRSAPLSTITAGIAQAAMGPKRVFVCGGTYDEHLVLGASQDGVGVYGGFDCSQPTWPYAAGQNAKVAPSTTGYALEVDLLTTGATFSDMEFDSRDAQNPGDSSIAVFANQSVVTFRRVVVIAGNGDEGSPGFSYLNYLVATATSGTPANSATGASQLVCNNCLYASQPVDGTDEESIGGAGGSNLSQIELTGGTGGGLSGGAGKAGSSGSACNNGGAGNTGANGPDAPPVLGATSHGALAATGWYGFPGQDGSVAFTAQGGGGGGANIGQSASTGGGGSGGCGGCGGGQGAKGTAGGSSFALLDYMSTITIDMATLTAGIGENGGQGGQGEPGQAPGAGGAGSAPGCAGGSGGTGGGGSGGGGGAGGLSVAIGYVGSPPTETGTVTKNVSSFGTGGPGGSGGGAHNAGGNGIDGVAVPELSL